MRHTCNQPHFWRRATTFLIITASMATVLILMSPGGLEAANPALEAIQSQISGLPPAWDKVLPANDTGDPCNSSRFTCVMGGTAVLDKETGLVWEQSPGDTDNDGDVDSFDQQFWNGARQHCINKNVGGRKGWRLPSVPELASLIDPANFNPALPTGHPFSNVQFNIVLHFAYWSASTEADNSARAWVVNFGEGVVGTSAKATSPNFVWCVRGPMNADQY